MAVEYGMPEQPTPNDYIELVKALAAGTNGRPSHVVILFLSQTMAQHVLLAASRQNLTGNFTWIASDAWGRNAHDFDFVQDIAAGAITIKISSTNEPTFDKHFAALNAANSNNPFLIDYWNAACNGSRYNCTRGSSFSTLKDVYKPESTVSLVKTAVYLLAHALHELFGQCR